MDEQKITDLIMQIDRLADTKKTINQLRLESTDLDEHAQLEKSISTVNRILERKQQELKKLLQN